MKGAPRFVVVLLAVCMALAGSVVPAGAPPSSAEPPAQPPLDQVASPGADLPFASAGELVFDTWGHNALRYASAVVDPATGLAYFGVDSAPGAILKAYLSDNYVYWMQVGVLYLEFGEDHVRSAVIDAARGFAYFGTGTSPGRVVKVRLDDLTRVGALTLNAGEDNLRRAVIDPTGNYAYFATGTAPGKIVRINLATFTHAGTLTLDPGEDNLGAAVMDPAGDYAYFGTRTAPGKVVKVRLSDFTRVGALTLGAGEDTLNAAVMDPAGQFACFGTETSPGRVVKVRLSDFTREGAVTLDAGENAPAAAVIEAGGQYAYFGTAGAAGKVVKIRLADMARLGVVSLTSYVPDPQAAVIYGNHAYFAGRAPNGTVGRVRLSDFAYMGFKESVGVSTAVFSGVLDPSRGYAYFGLEQQIVQVRLADFRVVGILNLGQGERIGWPAAAIDAGGGYAYFIAGSPATSTLIIRVRLSDFTRVASAAPLLEADGAAASVVIDPGRGSLFIGTTAGKIVQVRLSDLARVGAVASGINDPLISAGIDTVHGFAYFGTMDSNPGVVVKVRLSDLTVAGTLTLNAGEWQLTSAVVDPAHDYGYFGSVVGPIVRVRLSNLTHAGALADLSWLQAGVLDPNAGYAYFGAEEGDVVRVRLADFTHVGTLNTGRSLRVGLIDPAHGYAYFGGGARASDNGAIVRIVIGEAANHTAVPELVSPAPGATLTTLPHRFKMVADDPDAWQHLYYTVEIRQGGATVRQYDQRQSATGWDRLWYAPGATATLSLLEVLPDGTYTWRAGVFDGYTTTWSEEQPFTVAVPSTFAVTGITPEQALGSPGNQGFTIYGLAFVPGSTTVAVERALWDGSVERLTPTDVDVQSDRITFTLDLWGVSGAWEVVVTQGAAQGRTPLYVLPYLPLFSLGYRNNASIGADRWQRHLITVSNRGSAPGVAVIAVEGPQGALLTIPAQAGVEYLGSPAPQVHLLAVALGAGMPRTIMPNWRVPWEVINIPGQPPDPAKYDLGDPLRYRWSVIGYLPTEAWDALRAAAPGDLEKQVTFALWGGALMEGFAEDAYLNAADEALAQEYIERLGAAYPALADALVIRQAYDISLATYDVLDYAMPDSILPQATAGQIAGAPADGWFGEWVERQIGDPWAFAKAFLTGFDDVILSGQAGAMLILEAEGLVHGLTFGLWRPNLGGKTYAHITGLPASAVGAGHFIGNVLSIPVGGAIGKAAVKGLHLTMAKAHGLLRPADADPVWNGLKLTLRGNANEPQRFGISVLREGKDLPIIHWGNNPSTGGYHWAFGHTDEIVMINGVPQYGANGEALYGAGVHFYENHIYIPKGIEGVPSWMYRMKEQELRQAYDVVKEIPFAALRTGGPAIHDVIVPTLPHQDESACNDGAQDLVFAWDPNAIEGTPRQSHIRPWQALGLTVHFENMPTAAAPAETITVTLPIHDNLQWNSIRVGSATYTPTVTTDPAARTITWRLEEINLPPNTNPPDGEGSVSLTVSPRLDLVTGQVITASAKIVFDTNPPLWTDVITYTIDLDGPATTLAVEELAPELARLRVTATDNPGGSGVASVSILYSPDGVNWNPGPFLYPPEASETLTQVVELAGLGGHYWLRASALDGIGNIGPPSSPLEVTIPGGKAVYLPLVRK